MKLVVLLAVSMMVSMTTACNLPERLVPEAVACEGQTMEQVARKELSQEQACRAVAEGLECVKRICAPYGGVNDTTSFMVYAELKTHGYTCSNSSPGGPGQPPSVLLTAVAAFILVCLRG